MTSKAIIARKPGGIDVLEYVELDPGKPGPGEIRVHHTAVGVNFIDIYSRTGLYKWAGDTLIPGGEAAGTVEEIGEGVTSFKVGERVAYTTGQGSYRQHRNVPAHRLVKLPENIADDVAASIMLKGLTAHYLVRLTHQVQPGDKVLVHAAAGGVGLLVGQWLKHLGAIAIGTVSTPEKAALAESHGYAHVINYRQDDFVARVLEITGGKKLDVVYDSVGKDTWRGSLKVLKPRGLFVSFGQSSGPITDFSLLDLSAHGSLFATRPTLFDYIADPVDLQANAAELFELVGNATIKVDSRRLLPLTHAGQAHHDLENRLTTGATVLVP